MASDGAAITPFLALAVLWVVLPTFNFGFGTSELNPLQRALTCPTVRPTNAAWSPPPCLDLTNAQFGYITAGFTVGGFLGSIGLAPFKSIVPGLQRSKNALLFSGAWNVAGGLVQASAASWPILALGRLFMGIGSGIALVVVPGYLNDLSPPALQGSVGVLNQLSIVIGILTAQGLGVSSLADAPTQGSSGPWRFVPLVSSIIAALQLLLSPLAVDAPSDVRDGARIKNRLWGVRDDALNQRGEGGAAEAESLLAPEEPDADTGSESSSLPSRPTNVSFSTLLSAAFLSKRTANREQQALRRGTRMIIFTQMAQQLSGVNAVLYYSTGILSDVIKGDGAGGNGGDRIARWIGFGITFVNFLMTFPPIPLIDERRLGRKRLLQISSATMAVSALALGIALIRSYTNIAAASIVIFTAGFSAGLGPIPFLILPELVPRHAIPAASSLGIACNWLANITLASVFLPLKDALGGKVFFIFVTIDSIICLVISRFYSYSPPR